MRLTTPPTAMAFIKMRNTRHDAIMRKRLMSRGNELYAARRSQGADAKLWLRQDRVTRARCADEADAGKPSGID